jgi:acetyl esterase
VPPHPQAAALLQQFQEQGMPPFEKMSVAEARQATMGFKGLMGEPKPVANVDDHLIGRPKGETALGVRVYTPLGTPPFPILVYLHGSGWTIANVDVVDTVSRTLANVTAAVVVSVDYRKGPEHKYPAALDDCFEALQWAAEHAAEIGGNASLLGIIGDSAGGNLAAALTLLARERGEAKIAYQVLIYPAMDLAFNTTSYEENADGYLITRESMRWFWANYVNSPEEAADPLVSPLRAPNLAGLPPALIITAGYDPLRDEGEAFGKRLKEAGVPVKATRYEDMIHGFLWMGGVLDRTRQLFEEIGNEVSTALKAS